MSTPNVAYSDITGKGFFTEGEGRPWEPDAACLAAGDAYVLLALRCYAAAGLWDAAIVARLLRQAGIETDPPMRHTDAAVALARHGAVAGVSLRTILEWLARLAVEVPGWPDDPDEIVAIARAEVAEIDR